MKRFDEALEAVQRAAFMASRNGGAFAVVTARPSGFTVAPIKTARRHNLQVLEVCNP